MLISYMAIPGLPKREIVLSRDTQIKIILSVVCGYYSISEDAIVSGKRNRSMCDARHVCMWILRTMIGISTIDIGTIFNKDHTSVSWATHKVQDLTFENNYFKKDLHSIKKKIELHIKLHKNNLSENPLQLPQ